MKIILLTLYLFFLSFNKKHKMLQYLFNIVYPKVCLGCQILLLKGESFICTQCFYDLPYTHHQTNEINETYQKFYGLVPIEFGISFLYFNEKGIVQQLIHHLKYKGKQEIGTYLGNLLASKLESLLQKYPIDEIIPVPLHKKRLKQRGYNQIETFGKTLSNKLNIVYNNKLLFRNIYLETQTRKNKEERQQTQNIFEAQFSEENHNKHYLLIDDVITTGSTLEKCAQTLLQIPQARVSIATIAYTLS